MKQKLINELEGLTLLVKGIRAQELSRSQWQEIHDRLADMCALVYKEKKAAELRELTAKRV